MTEQEIAAIKAGDKITLDVEEVVYFAATAVDVRFKGAGKSGCVNGLQHSILTHATLTPAPEPPLAVGDVVESGGLRWEVAAPPRVSEDGYEWVALWRDDNGMSPAFVGACVRVPQ